MHSHPITIPDPTAKSATRPRRRLIALTAASLLALSGCGDRPDGDAPPGQPSERQSSPAEVGYIEVRPEAIDRLDPLPGRVVAYQVAEIRPQVSGIIQSRLFKEGSYVDEGQQLYQIDPARYEADYEMAQATLEDAEARRQNARTLAARYEKLIEGNAVSQQQYDDAVSALNRAEAAVSMAEAEVRRAKINLDYTEVRSPISGHIGPSGVTKGALVTEGQAMPLATVRQLDPVYVDLSQSAAAARDLRERLTAARLDDDEETEFPVTLYPTKTDEPYPHEGTLDAADLAVDPQTGSIRLRSIFPNPEKILLPGMFVRAAVEDANGAEEIVVPQKSVNIEPGGEKTVWVIDSEDRARKRTIRTGPAYRNRWVVLDGLEPGERVVVEGRMKLREDAEVRPEELQPQD